MSTDPVGWVATFSDGPLAGAEHDRIFAVGDPWPEIVLAPVGNVEIHGWTIVAGTGMPPPEEPWPDQATYRLAARSDPLGPFERTHYRVAFYELES